MMVDIYDDFQTWKKGQKRLRQNPKPMILALKPEIERLIKEGNSVKTIWEYFTEREEITCSYEAFVRNVKKHILVPLKRFV